MFDFAQARRFMVEGQIRTNEITDPGIVKAMNALARENFVPASWRKLAYSDHAIPAAETGEPGAERAVLNPMVLGKLIKAADIQLHEKVLHIGGTTGYGVAVTARLAGSVVALEEEPLSGIAARNLASIDVSNVDVVTGSLSAGYEACQPFDVILIEGAVETIPDALVMQLKDGGRLVAVKGAGRSGQGTVYRRTGDSLSGFPLFGAVAPVLPGFEERHAFVF